MSRYNRPMETQKQTPTAFNKANVATLQRDSILVPARDRSVISTRRVWIANHAIYYRTCQLNVLEPKRYTVSLKGVI